MIRKFEHKPLQATGYWGSLLRDHDAEERAKYYANKDPKNRAVYGGTTKKFPYLWVKCDWCGEMALLDDEGEREPFLKFEELLGWVSYAPLTGGELFHFCTRKCRIAFIDRHGSAVH